MRKRRIETVVIPAILGLICGLLAGIFGRGEGTRKESHDEGRVLTSVIDAPNSAPRVRKVDAHFDPESAKLILPLDALPFGRLPVALVEDSGFVSSEFCELLDLGTDQKRAIQEVIDNIISTITEAQLEVVKYHFTETGELDWIHIPKFDEGEIFVSLVEQLQNILGRRVTQLLIEGGYLFDRVLSRCGTEDLVFRFIHADGKIVVYEGRGTTKELADSHLYHDLPDNLPVWLRSFLRIERMR